MKLLIQLLSLVVSGPLCSGCEVEPLRVLSGRDAAAGDAPDGCSVEREGCDASAPTDAGVRRRNDGGVGGSTDAGSALPRCQCRAGSDVACVVFSGAGPSCQVTVGRRACQIDGTWGACDGSEATGSDGLDLGGATRTDGGASCVHHLIGCPADERRELSTGGCDEAPLCAISNALNR